MSEITEDVPVTIPTLEELGIELEDGMEDSEEFRAALLRGQSGQFENTLLEIWQMMLEKAIAESDGVVTAVMANGILRQWPWLRFPDLQLYLQHRATYLLQALKVLKEAYKKDEEELFAENVDDWLHHKDTYLDVVVGWTHLVNDWSTKWEAIDVKARNKPSLHAALSDVSAFLIDPRNGMVESMRNLAHFELTEEEGEALGRRITGETDE